MSEPNILRELRTLRDETARRHNYDVRSLVRELAELQSQEGRKVVRLPARRPATEEGVAGVHQQGRGQAKGVGRPALDAAEHEGVLVPALRWVYEGVAS